MTIDLAKLETGAPFDGDYDEALEAVQRRLERVQVAHIVHGARSMIVFEGWDAAGKGGTIRRLTARWDPRWFEVWPIAAPSEPEKARHFLWRFWQKLPAAREIAVFDRSWYGRVLVERVEGYASEADWTRAYDEINEFEAQMTDSGTTLVKLFLHVTQAEQDRRLAARLDDPMKRWKVTAEDFRNRARRDAYHDAMDAMFAATDTRWAPWHALDANSKKAARIAALTHVADVLEAAVPQDLPEPDEALLAMAAAAWGHAPGRSGD